jgi:CubicO group peptidase (beta-lactamase class C family)
MIGESEVAALVGAAGLTDAPLALSIRSRGERLDWVQNAAASEPFYGASLAKQVTGAAVALLVQRNLLDVDAPIGATLSELPAWGHEVTARHLLHHLGGIPQVDRPAAPGRWTNEAVMAQLRRSPALEAQPGVGFRYSNAGYVCLATIIERITGQRLADFARRNLFEPLGLRGIAFTDSPGYSQLAGMGDVLPQTLGGGGLWTTAAAFADWLDHQNRDTLGLAALMQQPGRLTDGTPTDYGWGIGLRRFGPHPLYIHAGGWPGAYSKGVRCPALQLSIIALTATDKDTPVLELVNAALEAFAEG